VAGRAAAVADRERAGPARSRSRRTGAVVIRSSVVSSVGRLSRRLGGFEFVLVIYTEY
jgi:hypothetical protein